jgi:hypothetical protein
MKKEFFSSYPQLKKKELQQLCVVADETLAADIVLPPTKEKKSSFGIADLLHMQQNMISAGRRWNGGFRIYYVRG